MPTVDVALDVSWLGNTYGQRWMRTGIHRVVERTAVLLGAHADVRLRLCATEHRDNAVASTATDPALHAIRFAGDHTTWIPDWVRRAQAALDARGRRPPLPVRLTRRALGEAHRGLAVARRLGRGPTDTALTPAMLAGAEVFHSPLSPLPGVTRRVRGLRRFLTVYDVFPQLMPALTWTGADAWNRRMTDSVTPDDWVLTISEHTRNDLLTLRPDLDPERVAVTYLSADGDKFYPCDDAERRAAVQRRLEIPDGVPYLLSVGSLVPHKNLPHLLRTFAELVRAERVDDLHLVLTGAQGWNYHTLAAALDGLGAVRDRVVITGYVDDADLAALYGGALAFVYPSVYEGFGLPPLEAMQCGVPVVASNTSSIPEVVGDAGVLLDPRDGDALAQALLDLYRDAALRAGLAERSLARAAHFTWERHAAVTVAAYERAL
jgi:glycosyltransferase involved in cell wall biosynthesis